MDIQRKAYSQLLQWKNATSSSKAILIKGARRVGKSYLAETFAKEEYASYRVRCSLQIYYTIKWSFLPPP